jgi:hypothetical protein
MLRFSHGGAHASGACLSGFGGSAIDGIVVSAQGVGFGAVGEVLWCGLSAMA